MVFFDLIGVIIGILFLHGTAQAPAPAENTATVPTATTQTIGDHAIANATDPHAALPSSPSVAALAKCLTKNGVIMYGAYWCPHCANQKKEFGTDFQFVHYQECDDKGPGGNSKLCQKAGVKGYPTWINTSKSTLEGEQTLEDLAKFAKCPYTK